MIDSRYKWVPVRTLASNTGVPEMAIRRYLREGMPHLKEGQRLKVRYSDLEQFIANGIRRSAILPAADIQFLIGLLQ